MDPDFNSSDVDFEPAAPKLNPFAGKASIDRIVEDAAQDRLTSKKRVKQLTFGRGMTSTRLTQSLWINRFEAFREHTLKQSLDKPFNGADLIRFLDSVLNSGKLKLLRNKACPNDDLAWLASKILLCYGEFRWSVDEGFKFTAQDRARLATFVDDCCREGRLSKGHWFKKTWIGFVTLSRMIRAYLSKALTDGTPNWDIIIARCLSIVLLSALGCRAGDVAQTVLYQGAEYLHFRDVELYLVENANKDADQLGTTSPVTLANLRATITLRYTKGRKDRMNADLVKHLKPLLHEDCHHVCPITLLLIHTLRHGLVEGGTTIQQILDHAARRPDQRIVWTHPDWPVLCQFTNPRFHDVDMISKCNLDRAARPPQLCSSIKRMGVVSGLLDRVYTHALRLGAARDMRHVPASTHTDAFAFGDHQVRRSLGHSMNSHDAGITDRYAGDDATDFYSARAAAKVVHMREPKVAAREADVAASVLKPITRAELKGRSHSSIHEDRLEALRETTAVQGQQSRQKVSEPSPLPAPSNKKTKSSMIASSRGPSAAMPLAERSVNVQQSVQRNTAAGNDTLFIPEAAPADNNSNIDPALLDDDPVVAQADINNLVQMVLPQAEMVSFEDREVTDQTVQSSIDAADEANQDEAVLLLLDDDKDDTTHDYTRVDASTLRFIDTYSRYNINCNWTFSRQWSKYASGDNASFQDAIAACSVQGNTRDDPTPYMWHCRVTPGCTFASCFETSRQTHEVGCSEPKKDAVDDAMATSKAILDDMAAIDEAYGGPHNNPRRCHHAGCDYVTLVAEDNKVKHSMAVHVSITHNWVAKPCEHGCAPDKLYSNRNSYATHQSRHHSNRWPVRCRFPECTSTVEFRDSGHLKLHLSTSHNVASDDAHTYMPAPEANTFVPQTCIVDGCSTTVVFQTRSKLREHLQRKTIHNMSKDSAEALITTKALFSSTPRTRKLVNAPKSSQVKASASSVSGSTKKRKVDSMAG